MENNENLQLLNNIKIPNNSIQNPSINIEEKNLNENNSDILLPPVYANPNPISNKDDNLDNKNNDNILDLNLKFENENENENNNEDIINIDFNLPSEKNEEEKENLNHNLNNNNNINQNINIPNYQLSLSKSNQKLNEPITDSLKRDLFLIYNKLKYVINPYLSNKEKNKHIKQWDLFGPLIFTLLLSFTLAIRGKNKGEIFTLIFIIFWFGSFLVYINTHLLEVKISIFHIFCLLGYCLFPLNISSFILMLYNFHEIIRILIIVFCCFWSSISASSFLNSIVDNNEIRGLVLYPSILLYLFISGVILMNRF